MHGKWSCIAVMMVAALLVSGGFSVGQEQEPVSSLQPDAVVLQSPAGSMSTEARSQIETGVEPVGCDGTRCFGPCRYIDNGIDVDYSGNWDMCEWMQLQIGCTKESPPSESAKSCSYGGDYVHTYLECPPGGYYYCVVSGPDYCDTSCPE